MSKQGIMGSVMQLARANVDVIVDSAPDQEQALSQLLDEYAAAISAAEQAVTQLNANRRLIEGDQAQDAAAAVRWGEKAAAASRRADELRAGGRAAEADRFDDLARAALEHQLIAECDVRTVQHTIDAQSESAQTLRAGVDQMTARLAGLRRKRESLGGRSPATHAPPRPRDAAGSADIMDPASELTRFEESMGQEEERLHGQAAPSAEYRFAAPQDAGSRAEIENRLRELKADRAMASATARAHDQMT